MKLTLTYGSSFDFIITTTNENFTCERLRCTLQDAVEYAETFFNDETAIRAKDIVKIVICDHHTGEIVAECEPSPVCDETSSLNEDCNYNEDMGFDPYLGCYTDDC